MLTVLHLDHTTEEGGAELALARMLLAEVSWQAHLVTAVASSGGLGAFAGVSANPLVLVRSQRLLHPPRLIGSAGSATRVARDALRLAAQAAVLIVGRPVRESSVIHANTSRAALYASIAAAVTRKPLVVHLRDFVSPEVLGRLGVRLFRSVVLPRVSGVIANSEATLATASPYVPTGALRVVIPSPIGFDSAPPPPVADRPVRRVVMVARIDDWKGQNLLIRAFAAAFAGSAVMLEFAGAPAFGKDELVPSLLDLARRLGLQHQVRFIGHVHDIATYIDSADICVQASLRPEPLGQNVLQYLARGKAVIAADEGGPREWIRDGENGLLFPPRDELGLASCLRRLAADDELRLRLGRAARSTPGLLSDSEIAAAHGDAFRTVVARSREARPAR